MSRRYLVDVERNEVVSVPVAPAVQEAIDRATTGVYDALVRELEPFGLTPFDIVVPTYEQVIYEDEVPIFAALVRGRDEDEGREAGGCCGASGCA